MKINSFLRKSYVRISETKHPVCLYEQYALTKSIMAFFLVSVLFYVYPGFSFPSTETFMYRTLLSGKLFYMYSDTTWEFYDPIKEEGRLQLLVGVPQNIAFLFTKFPTVASVYLIQAGLVFIACMTMMLIFRELGLYNKLAFYSIIALVFSKTFVFSFYHPVLAEGLLIIFLAATILFYLRCLNDSGIINVTFLIIFSILVCVSKISGAFILLVFGVSMALSNYLAKPKVSNRYLENFILMLVPLIWFATSRLIVGNQENPGDPIFLGTKYLQLTWVTDVIVFLFIVPFGVVLPILGLIKGDQYNLKTQACSCLCFTAACYAALLILYGKHGDYHLAPVYFLAVFAVPVAVAELSRIRQVCKQSC